MNEAEITCGGCGRTYKARWDGRVIVFERGHDAERPAPCSEESKGRAERFYDAWALRYAERPIGERFIVPHSYEAMFRLMDEYAASTNFRQSPSPTESGAESAWLRKENTVDEKASAETGGEKAAAPRLGDKSGLVAKDWWFKNVGKTPFKMDPYHIWRYMEDFAESREPEKLNNAQKCKHERLNADGVCDCGYWVGNPVPVALAESSLSSPLPKEKL